MPGLKDITFCLRGILMDFLLISNTFQPIGQEKSYPDSYDHSNYHSETVGRVSIVASPLSPFRLCRPPALAITITLQPKHWNAKSLRVEWHWLQR